MQPLALMLAGGAAVAAVAAPAAPNAAPVFAPRPGETLRYVTTERRDLGHGRSLMLRSVRDISFARAGDGWTVRCRIVALDSDGPDDLVTMLALPQAILSSLVVEWRLDAAGAPVGMAVAEQSWAPVAATVDALRLEVEAEPPGLSRAARLGLIARLAGLDDAGRAALLWGEVAPLLPLTAAGGWTPDAEGFVRRAENGVSAVEERVDGRGLLVESRLAETIRIGGETRINHRVIRAE